MKFKLTKTSDKFRESTDEKEIEFNTLDELLDFIQKHDNEVIITPPYRIPCLNGNIIEEPWGIEIYDDYRE